MEIKYEDYCKRIDEVMSFYQSKRAGLKKQLTHWIGKFMIVKQENNKLRSMNTALLKRINQLQEHIVKADTQKYVRIINEGLLRPLPTVKRTVHEKEPIKC